MEVQTRVSRWRRIWVCPICGFRATISRGRHVQTNQPLTREQQIGSLAFDAQKHFREQHKNAFMHRK